MPAESKPIFPSWPYVFLPQQDTEPLSSTAQVKSSPAAISTAVLPAPRLVVCVGVFLCVVVPSPSWPYQFGPQQATEPLSNMEHVWYWPAVISTADRPELNPEVCVGLALSTFVPSPSDPQKLPPQQTTEPSSRIAHECCSCPVVIATAVLPAPRLEVCMGVF